MSEFKMLYKFNDYFNFPRQFNSIKNMRPKDGHLMMCPETDTLNKSNTIPKYLGIHAALRVFEKIEKKKSYCLDIFIFLRDQ